MNILLATILALALTPTAHLPESFWVTGPPAAKVMQLATREGSIGHGCPVQSPQGVVVLTARHMTETEEGEPIDILTWSDNAGGSGHLEVVVRDGAQDIASLVSKEEPLEFGFLFAETPPKAGDVIRWYEYSFRNAKEGLRNVLRTSKVTRNIALHIVSVPAPMPGASGSCVFNMDGDVVGIVSAGFDMLNKEEVSWIVDVTLEAQSK